MESRCNKCSNLIGCKQIVTSPQKSDVMFIGDFPPKEDYEKYQHISRPSSRSKLSMYKDILNTIRPYSYYVTNYIKCYTAKQPKPFQYTNCKSNLESEISIVNPSIIIYLGNKAGSLKFSVKEAFRPRYMHSNGVHHILLLHPHQSLLKPQLFEDSLKFLNSILPHISNEEQRYGIQSKDNN